MISFHVIFFVLVIYFRFIRYVNMYFNVTILNNAFNNIKNEKNQRNKNNLFNNYKFCVFFRTQIILL